MRLKEKYPNLGHFFGCYFNQDWDYDYATPADGVNDFIDRAAARIPSTVSELKVFLQEFNNDKELNLAVGDLGNEYDPDNDGLTVRLWLANKVLPLLEKHLTERDSSIAKSA